MIKVTFVHVYCTVDVQTFGIGEGKNILKAFKENI
jgi:hypothetical protein